MSAWQRADSATGINANARLAATRGPKQFLYLEKKKKKARQLATGALRNCWWGRCTPSVLCRRWVNFCLVFFVFDRILVVFSLLAVRSLPATYESKDTISFSLKVWRHRNCARQHRSNSRVQPWENTAGLVGSCAMGGPYKIHWTS